MTAETYRRITDPIRAHGLGTAVHSLNQVFSSAFYASFPVLLALRFFTQKNWFTTMICAAIPFVLLSIFRRIMNRPRPYEILDIDPLIHRSSKGCSFPSRHVFSAFLIAVLWIGECMPFGILLLILAALLAILRVIGGVHYPADVIAGAVFGICSGMIGLLFSVSPI